jgi:3-deoxy-D-manno-octulosonic-acid transferase
MTAAYFFYRTLTRFLAPLGPVFTRCYRIAGKDPEVMHQRWGTYPEAVSRPNRNRPRIWMHAASVGEVRVASVMIGELSQALTDCEFIVSTTTETGHARAKQKLPPGVSIIYAPLDIPSVVEKALTFIHPDILVFVETEIWPNWVCRAQALGVKILLVNGRISMRSIKKYLRIKSIMGETLKRFDVLSMMHREDAQRILSMGGPQEKIRIHGNAKFDGLMEKDDSCKRQSMQKIYSVHKGDKVFVAGSTREGEEELILKAYKTILQSHPDLHLFMAPRHVERSGEVADLVKNYGFSCRLRSHFGAKDEIRDAPVVIIDIIGELSSVYGLSTLCFCGGSLVPKGGQNILEAAAWGKPVFYGPHMEDFREARDLIEEAVGEAFLVKSWHELAEKVVAHLNNASLSQTLGKKAGTAILKNSGAARKHALEILKVFYPSG